MSKIFTKEDAEKLQGDYIVIPDGYTEISNEAFEDHYSLKSITLPSGLERVASDAFEYCYNLTEIIVPEDSMFKEKIGIFKEFEEELSRDGVGVPDSVLTSFRRKCHRYIFDELNAELMHEMLSFVFAPFLDGYATSVSDNIELTPELYSEMKQLYTDAYNNGIASLRDVKIFSHPVISFAIRIADEAGVKYLGGKEITGKNSYSWSPDNNILSSREDTEKEKCKTETSWGYSFINTVMEAMCSGRCGHHSRYFDCRRHDAGFTPALFDYLMRAYRRQLPDYKLSVFEERIDRVCELLYIAICKGMEGLKPFVNEIDFLDFAISEYYKDEYTKDENNYEVYDALGRLYRPASETRKKVIQALKKHCSTIISNAVAIEEAALLDLTMSGIIFIINGENPRIAREYLEFIYGAFWNDGFSWDASDDALICRVEQIRHFCDVAHNKNLFYLFEEINSKEEDIFIRFALNQLFDGVDRDCWYNALYNRINNELLTGKTDYEVRLLKLTAEGMSMLAQGIKSDEIYIVLNKIITEARF